MQLEVKDFSVRLGGKEFLHDIKPYITKFNSNNNFMVQYLIDNPKISFADLNEYFNSTTDVYNKYGIDPSSIRKVIRGVNKSAGRHPSSNVPLHWIELKERVNVGKFDDDK